MRALLPDAPNPNGWPYRLMVAADGHFSRYGEAYQAGHITHVINITRPGGHHFRFAELLKDRAMVWLPWREGQSLPQVIDDELAYIEYFVDRLPADAGFLLVSNVLGAPALAVAKGLLARQVGWGRAETLSADLQEALLGKVGPTPVLVEAWMKRLEQFSSNNERS
jgi:hypothetical protein